MGLNMSKLFYYSILPIIALVTMFIGYTSAQSQMEKLREFEAYEAKQTQVNQNGTINMIIEKKYNPYYQEVIK